MFKIGRSNVVSDRTDKLSKLWKVDLSESYFVECGTPDKIENGLHNLLHETRITEGLPKQDGYTEWFHIDSLEIALSIIKVLGLSITKGIEQIESSKKGINYWQFAEECRIKNIESVNEIIEFLSNNTPIFMELDKQSGSYKIKFEESIEPPFKIDMFVEVKNLTMYSDFLSSRGLQYKNEDIRRYETTVNCGPKYSSSDRMHKIWDEDSPYYNSETSQQARLALDEASSKLYNFLVALEVKVNSNEDNHLPQVPINNP